MSLSKAVISGKVTRNPEKRFTPTTNIAVTEFSIAVESLPRPDGQVESTPIKVITWRELADRCANEIKKGDLVAIDGRLQINNYQTNEGIRKREIELDAISVENLTKALGTSNSSIESDFSSVDSVTEVAKKVNVIAPKISKSEELDSIFASEDEIPF